MANRTLLVAYGNPDRQDDGVSWFVLKETAKLHGVILASPYDDFYAELGKEIDYFFILQLTPELVDLICEYDQVCFIDAHLGDDLDEVHLQRLTPNYEPSTLSHHMTPQFLLDIALATHQRTPDSVLLSIRGYEFAFVNGLSGKTKALATEAVNKLDQWLLHKS